MIGTMSIVIAMKPIGDNFSDNALRHGVSGLNIDGCRVSSGDDYHGLHVTQGGDHFKINSEEKTRGTVFQPAAGRWPSNLVLAHASACRRVGVKRVKSAPKTEKGKGWSSEGSNEGWKAEAHKGYDEGRVGGYGDEDGMETVEDWECAEGCPVKAMDDSSGELAHRGNKGGSVRGEGVVRVVDFGTRGESDCGVRFNYDADGGGASRFFKVIKELEI